VPREKAAQDQARRTGGYGEDVVEPPLTRFVRVMAQMEHPDHRYAVRYCGD